MYIFSSNLTKIVICTTSYESHTFFSRIFRLINKGVARVNQAINKKETFITCCTHYFFAYRCKLRNLVQKDYKKRRITKKRYALTIISRKWNKMMQESTTFTTILRVKKCHFHYDMQKI
jgi:hypothetical protein